MLQNQVHLQDDQEPLKDPETDPGHSFHSNDDQPYIHIS